MRLQVVKGIGGRVWAEFSARPSSVTCTVKRSGGSDLSGSAIVDQAATRDPMICTYTGVAALPEGEQAIPCSMVRGSYPEAGVGVEILGTDRASALSVVAAYRLTAETSNPPLGVVTLRNPTLFAR
jgi:hypothetical protein